MNTEKKNKGLISMLLVLATLLSGHLNAQNEWKIFTQEYSFNKGVTLAKTLKSKNIVDIVKAKDGTVWLACGDTYPIHIMNIDKSDFTIGVSDFEGLDFRPSRHSKLLALPNGEVWLLTPDKLLRLKNPASGWNKYTDNSTPDLNFTEYGDMALDSNGNIWVSGVTKTKQSGVAKLENGRWTFFMGLTNGESLNHLTFDKNGHIWMSAETNTTTRLGLYEFSDGKFKSHGAEIQTNNIYDIALDHNGILFVATDKGLMIRGANGVFHPSEKNIRPKAMAFDNLNNLWWSKPFKNDPDPMVTRYDLTRNSSLSLTSENSPLTWDAKKIYIDENNVKYFILSSITDESDGLFALKELENKYPNWEIYTCNKVGSEAMAEYDFDCGFNDESGFFYGIGSYRKNRCLNIFKNGQWEHNIFMLQDDNRGISDGHGIWAAAKNSRGELYLGTTNYLYKYDKVSPMVQGIDQKQLSKLTKCMTADTKGNIWMGTYNGLAKYDGNTFTYYDKKNSKLPSNQILSILADKENRTWVGTPDGVVCFDGDNQSLFNKKSGMEKERVVTIAKNSEGKVYFGATNVLGAAKYVHYAENGIIKQEQLPFMLLIENMAFDKNDNLWINGRSYIVCRKKNGECITYDDSNSPLKNNYSISQIYIVNDELWMNVGIHNDDPNALHNAGPSLSKPPLTKEGQILERLKEKFNGSESNLQIMVLKIDKIK